eukprot:87438_1
MAMRRLNDELRDIELNPLRNAHVVIVNGDLFKWQVTLTGPPNTPYQKGKFVVLFSFPQDYPFRIPSIKFKTKIFHANISKSNHPTRDNISVREWGCIHNCSRFYNPTIRIKEYIFKIQNILMHPDVGLGVTFCSRHNEAARRLCVRNKKEYNDTANRWAVSIAGAKVLNDNKKMEITTWMTDVVLLPQYTNTLIDNGIDQIAFLSDVKINDLKEIGIEMLGHRRRIMSCIERIND